MDAVKFIKERDRMFEVTNQMPSLSYRHQKSAEEIVREVEEWSAANPRETRQSVFIRQHPKVTIYKGVIGIRPCQIDEDYTSKYCTCDSSQCVQCRKEYWLQEVN